VVGGVSGLCVFLLLLLALLFIIALKRKSNRQKKLSQPDYEELAYADVDDVVMTRKMQEVCAHTSVGCSSNLMAMSAYTPELLLSVDYSTTLSWSASCSSKMVASPPPSSKSLPPPMPTR
jgi:hypothetical protein